MTQLHIFALNEPVTVSHTNLTRQKGEAPDLPLLTEWLGLDALDTDQIEMFPVDDLGGMALSDYIQLAFTPETGIPADDQRRLDALEGAVLLVPDNAISGTFAPGPQATEIAKVPLAQPDNTATLPKAEVSPAPSVKPHSEPERETVPPIALYMLLAIAAFAVLAIFVGWN
ncbi:hypothetical protein [Gymnodinialimonas hymeniacidonis]|uniref:hypothetical protein n=1 Tax=Gymnodinialimonas hymeniacidonis TaxID=3126508 RepID=UPI0034C65C7A